MLRVMSGDIEVLRQAHEAYNRGDLDALREFYTPDVSADAGELWPASGRVHGVEHVLAEFASIMSTFEQVEVIAEDYIECSGAIVVPSRWRGRVSGSNSVIEQPIVAAYWFRDGRVCSIGYYGDLDAAMTAVEGESPTPRRSTP